MITIEQLKAIMPRAGARALVFVLPLAEAMAHFEINTPRRQAAFLAQIAHESGCLRYTAEIASGAAYEFRKDLGNTIAGDGKRYKLNVRLDDAFDGVTYQAAFETPVGAWTQVRLPLSAFLPTFRGRAVPGAPALDPALVRHIGLVIADRQAGPFALDIRRISLV